MKLRALFHSPLQRKAHTDRVRAPQLVHETVILDAPDGPRFLIERRVCPRVMRWGRAS